MKMRLSSGQGILLFFCTLIISPHPGFSQYAARDLLNHLEGKWIMSGSVMGKQVQYMADGIWVLQNQWFCLHMKDTSTPSEYEADVYIGIDSVMNEYVAHWLDSFGGAGARVAGVGPVSSDRIEIVYPYAEGKFRNYFIFYSTTNAWNLVIESESKDGSWTNFANFNINSQMKE